MMRQPFEWLLSLLRTLSQSRFAGCTPTPSTLGVGVPVIELPDDLTEVPYITLLMAEDGEWDLATNCDQDEIAAGLSELLFKMACRDRMVWEGED